MRIKTLEDLNKLKDKGLKSIYPDRPKITVGTATCGLAAGGRDVLAAIETEVSQQNLDVVVAQTGCIGFCEMEPLVYLWSPGKPRFIYKQVTAAKVKQIIEKYLNGEIVKDWVLGKAETEEFIIQNKIEHFSTDESTNGEIPFYDDLPFNKKQVKIALRNCGFIDPENIDEYIARGGYQAIYKTLTEMDSDEIIEVITKSGLRGRGGGGFPAGVKWKTCKNAEGNPKYVICNADEGDPGAYMDRSLLEGDPHSTLEGMLIGAYAINSSEGYIYVRHEYPQAIRKINKAIQQSRDYGLLGKNIFDTGFDFDIEIHRGAGAFVCGESTALMASLEGKVGEPRAKYIHTVEHGLWDRPSNLNNVETWANVAPIIVRGVDWFTQYGTGDVSKNPWGGSKGTKVFSLVGNIVNTGLVEIPMGMSLQDLIFEIGGGIPGGKKFKGVQTGGPSGGVVVIPPEKLDVHVDYDNLSEAGSMMGSGGMIVMDEHTCMVDVSKYFMEFLMGESCGKCVPCREGLRNSYDILTRITEGKGRSGDLELLEEVGTWMIDAALCALGSSAPNPFLSTIRYFRDEYEAHIVDKKCPAGVCKELIQYTIDAEKCSGCMVCLRDCPELAITGEKKMPHFIDQEKCNKCGNCYDVCKFDAVIKV